MKAIKRELGEDEESVEIKELEDRIKAAKLPEEAEKVAMKELERLWLFLSVKSINIFLINF